MAETNKTERAQLYSAREKVQATADYDYVKDGVIYMGGGGGAVMISDESELALLTEYQPGTIAFTAGFAKMWQLSADGAWVEVESSGGSGGGGDGGGGVLFVGLQQETESDVLTMDKTGLEILQAMTVGKTVYATFNSAFYGIIVSVDIDSNRAIFSLVVSGMEGTSFDFIAQSLTDYPQSPIYQMHTDTSLALYWVETDAETGVSYFVGDAGQIVKAYGLGHRIAGISARTGWISPVDVVYMDDPFSLTLYWQPGSGENVHRYVANNPWENPSVT